MKSLSICPAAFLKCSRQRDRPADTAIRGQDLDEARALEAKRKAEEHIKSSHGDVDYAQASAELAKAIAKLRVIELTKSDVTPA